MKNLVTKLFVVLTGFICTIVALSPLSFDSKIHKVQESGSECILKLARRFVNPASIISIMSSGIKSATNTHTGITTEQLILKKIMDETNWTLMTKTAKMAKHDRMSKYFKRSGSMENDLMFMEKVHAYILFVRTRNDLVAILAFLKNTLSWNPHANFILYMDIGIDGRAERDLLLMDLINLAWTYLVINLTIIVPDTAKYNQQIITWFPFDEGNCGKQKMKMQILGVCELGRLVPPDTNYFPQKVPLNLNRCPIRIGTLVWPPFILSPTKRIASYATLEISYNFEHGIEIEIVKTVAAHANFTIQFRSLEEPENWGTVEDGGTGLIGMLVRHEVDIAIGTFTPTKIYHQNFDFTIQYTQDKTTWLVPTPELIPQWQSLIDIFQPQAWIASFLIYIIVSIVTFLLGVSSQADSEYQKFRHPYGTFLVIWAIMFGSASPNFPKTTKMKFFLFLWLLYCMHLCTAYTTYLVSMLTTPVYGQRMTSFYDILAAHMDFGMQQPTTRYFQQNEYIINKMDDMIMKNYELCNSAAICLDRIATTRDFAMAISRQYFEFIERNYKDQFGNSLIKAFQDDIVTSPVEMLLVKGHPLLPRIDDILLGIVQAGLIDIWADQIKQDISLQDFDSTSTLLSAAQLSNKKVLSFYHLQGAFMALGFGLTIASIQFIIEMFVHKK